MVIENRTDAGLVVVRGGLDAGLASDFEAECAGLVHSPLPEAGMRRDRGGDKPYEVFSRTYDTDYLGKAGLRAVPRVLALLEREQGYRFTVNCQLPWAAGDFHDDAQADAPMFVIQGSGDGAFDYALDATTDTEAEGNACSITVNAGDIIMQRRPEVLHRGRNLGGSNRYNAVIWRPAPPLSLEEALIQSRQEEQAAGPASAA